MQHNAYVFLCENMVWFVNIHDQMLYNFISIFVVQCCHIVLLASNEVIKKKVPQKVSEESFVLSEN